MARVKIRNSQTGEIKEIDDTQMSQYGIQQTQPQPQVQPQYNAPQMTQPSTAGMVGKTAIGAGKSAASLIGSLAMNAPKLAINIAKEFIKPAVKGAKTIASGAEEGIQSLKYMRGDKNAFKSPIIPDRLKLSKQEKQQVRDNPVEEGIKQVAGVGSYAIPFGKVGFIGSKAILPGAAVGGLRSISEGDNPDEVLGNAIIGGAAAGTLQMAGKAISKLKGGTAKTSKISGKLAEDLEQGTRQIKQKASVYGAGQEKNINKTLDKLGFKGTPQQQYENLQPAMQKLEGKVQEFIKANPQITVPKEDIKQSFITNLKSSLRSGELTEAQAIKETNKYLNDLVKASGGTGKFTNIDIGRLRELKKLVNEDFGPIKSILDRGGNLTPKQHVIKVAWDSLDNAVKTSAPEVKGLLLDESNLYKAAQSLSSARANPPTLRAFGVSLPQKITQGGRNVLKSGLQNTSQGLGNISNAIPSINPNSATQYAGGQAASLVPRLGGGPGVGEQQLQEEHNNVESNNNQQYSDHAQSLPQSPNDVNLASSEGLGETPTLNQYGASPEIIYREYQNALAAGDKKTAAMLRTMFEDETKYQKANAPSKNKALSVAGSKEVSRNQTALNDIKTLETILENDPSKLILSALPGSLGARKYRALWGGIIDAIGTNRTGATYTPEQRKDYAYLLPALGDSPQEVAFKMERIRNEVQNFLHNVSTSVPDYYQESQTDYSSGLGAEPPAL